MQMATPVPSEGAPVGSRTVRLQSCDGKNFEVPLDVVRVSRTIDTMLKSAYTPALHRHFILDWTFSRFR